MCILVFVSLCVIVQTQVLAYPEGKCVYYVLFIDDAPITTIRKVQQMVSKTCFHNIIIIDIDNVPGSSSKPVSSIS